MGLRFWGCRVWALGFKAWANKAKIVGFVVLGLGLLGKGSDLGLLLGFYSLH